MVNTKVTFSSIMLLLSHITIDFPRVAFTEETPAQVLKIVLYIKHMLAFFLLQFWQLDVVTENEIALMYFLIGNNYWHQLYYNIYSFLEVFPWYNVK